MYDINKLPSVERKLDGSLISMTSSQRKMVKTLIQKNCSHYYEGDCLHPNLPEETPCPQIISNSINCRYFRHIVLEDKAGEILKSELFEKNALRRCTVCGRAFSSKSNNAKYCEICRVEVHRKQKAEHARKRRTM